MISNLLQNSQFIAHANACLVCSVKEVKIYLFELIARSLELDIKK